MDVIHLDSYAPSIHTLQSHAHPLKLPTTIPTQSPTATFVVMTAPATAVGFSSSSTMNGIYSFFPPGDVVYWYYWNTCADYYTSPIRTGNGTFTSAGGNGSIPGYLLTGLANDTLYCFSSCAFASIEPDRVLCGGVETFQWTTAVRGGQ